MSTIPEQGPLLFKIPYLPPYAWKEMLAFLRARSVARLEETTDTSYRRVMRVALADTLHRGWVEVCNDLEGRALNIALSPSLAPVSEQAVARLKHFFDVDCRPDEIAAALGDLSAKNPGLRVPGCFDPFEVSTRAVLGQQITVKAAHTLVSRLVRALGDPVGTPYPALDQAFPSPQSVLGAPDDLLGGLGIVKMRIRALRALAEAALKGELEPQADAEAQIRELKKLPGIGDWTAQYIAMRALDWPDAFPHTDYGVKTALGKTDPTEILKQAEGWRPWRAYAVMHLWNRLSDEKDKNNHKKNDTGGE